MKKGIVFFAFLFYLGIQAKCPYPDFPAPADYSLIYYQATRDFPLQTEVLDRCDDVYIPIQAGDVLVKRNRYDKEEQDFYIFAYLCHKYQEHLVIAYVFQSHAKNGDIIETATFDPF